MNRSIYAPSPPLPTNTPGQYNLMQHHVNTTHEEAKIYALVVELMDPATRETALLELSKKREQYEDLALVLWHSFGEHLPPYWAFSTLCGVFIDAIVVRVDLIYRHHGCSSPRNRRCLPSSLSTCSYRPRIK